MAHSRYEKMALCLFTILFISVALFINIANAETGTITITDSDSINFTSGPAADLGVPLYDRLLFDTNNYNSIDFLDVVSDANSSFLLQSNFTFFTCNAPNSCTGAVSYSKTGNIIEWAFDSNAVITSSPIIFTYQTNIFDNYNIDPANGNAAYFGVNSTIPVCLAFPGSLCTGRLKNTVPATTVSYYRAVVMLETSIDYNITYPISGKYSGRITKVPGPLTKVKFEEHDNTIDFAETTFNNVSFNIPLLDYGQGLYINLTMQNTYNRVLINSTNAGIATPASTPTVGVNGVGIVFDFATYTPNSVANISWIRNGSIPFGSVDKITLFNPSSGESDYVIDPGTFGYKKTYLSNIGTYKVMYNRTGLFGLGTSETLDYDTALVTSENPSYIIANGTVPSGIAFNATYSFGYTPQIQGELNSIKIERIDLQDITYYTTVSLNNNAIAANTEYNISLTISGLGKYKLSLFDISRGFVASTIVQTVEVPIPIERNITTSYISTDLATYFKGDNMQISYGIDNTNFSGYPEKYIRIIHSSGTYPETGRILTSKQEDIINVDITEQSTWFKWFSGVNYVELHAKNSTTDLLITNTSFTLAFIDTDGYGLEVTPPNLCTGGSVQIKTSSPSSTLFTVDVYQKSSSGNKIVYYQNYVNGSNKTRNLKLVYEGEYFFNLFDTSNASRFVKSVKVDNANCAGTPIPTGTQTPPASTIGTNIMNFATTPAFWGLIIWILAVFGVASTGKQGEDRSKAIELVAVIAAALEVILGLWHPFTWWVVAILIIALGAKFYAGRQLTRDG